MAEIIREEKLLEEVLNQEVIKVPEGANPEDYGIKNEPQQPVEGNEEKNIEENKPANNALKGVGNKAKNAIEEMDKVQGGGGGIN